MCLPQVFFENPELCNGIVVNLPDKCGFQLDTLFELLQKLKPQQVAMFETKMKGNVHHVTLGPGSLLVVPPGFLVAERSLSSGVNGVRKYFLNLDTSALADVAAYRPESSQVVDVLIRVAEKLWSVAKEREEIALQNRLQSFDHPDTPPVVDLLAVDEQPLQSSDLPGTPVALEPFESAAKTEPLESVAKKEPLESVAKTDIDTDIDKKSLSPTSRNSSSSSSSESNS